MARRSRIDRLDQAVEAILARREAAAPVSGARPGDDIAALARIAEDLRELPRQEFRARLRADLERRASMSAKNAQVERPLEAGDKERFREGFHTVTPYIVVNQAAELIDFVKRAFGGEELLRTTGTGGGIHAEVRIDDSMVMIGGGGAWRGTPMPTALHLYVKDADAAYRRAVEAGATSLYEPQDMPYGDREAGVRDPSGNNWYIGTNKATGHLRQGLRSVTPALHPRGAPELIAFLKRAFDAQEIELDRAPDGTVAHAKLRIGDSVVEMGEARDPFGPMPTMFYLYVNDADAWYRRAVEAGAASLSVPADQPYGDRVAAVTDSFGNQWYMATPIGKTPPEAR
jgi:uncharacterized glyoxalase superfamily protein PhnB